MEDKSPLLLSTESRENSEHNQSQCHKYGQSYTCEVYSHDEANGSVVQGLPPGLADTRSERTTVKCTHSCVQKITALCISCLAKFVTGAVFVFFVYQDAIKYTYSYSQKEVEVLASMMNIGLGLGFLPGLFFDKFGPRMTSLAGLIISSGSYLLVWSSTYTVEFFRDKSWLMAIFFLFTGFGPGFSLMVALNTNIMNFHERHTGKVVGTMNAFFAGSPSVFATVYYNLFTTGDDTKPENQDFRGYMLMIAIMFCVINVLNFIFVYKIPLPYFEIAIKTKESIIETDKESLIETDKERVIETDKEIMIETTNESENSPLLDNTKSGEEKSHKDIESDNHIPFLKLLLNTDYILFLVVFSVASTASIVFGVNITAISKAVKLDSYNRYLTIISPITNALFSIGIGFFSDYFKDKIPRLQIVISGCVAFALCYLLVVVCPTSIVALMIAAFCCGIGIAFLYSMTPTLLKEMFHMKDFGRNWGAALFAQSAVSMPSQILFGVMYDSHVTSGDSHDCYGSKCIVGGMSVFLGISVAAILVGIVMLNTGRCRRLCSPKTH